MFRRVTFLSQPPSLEGQELQQQHARQTHGSDVSAWKGLALFIEDSHWLFRFTSRVRNTASKNWKTLLGEIFNASERDANKLWPVQSNQECQQCLINRSMGVWIDLCRECANKVPPLWHFIFYSSIFKKNKKHILMIFSVYVRLIAGLLWWFITMLQS